MNIGLQLYSVRDVTEHGLLAALAQIARLGYANAEFAGFFGVSAADVKRALDENGLRVSGTHTMLEEIRDRFDETVAYHKAIGNTRIIIPGADLSDQAKLSAFVRDAEALRPRLAEKGIALGYHNHSHEFQPNADGSRIYETLIAETALQLELDTYWAYAAGQDPLALMERLRSRLPVIHLKDGLADGTGKPLGQGVAPVEAVYRKALEMGVDVVVESETLTPDGLTEAKACIEYIRGL